MQRLEEFGRWRLQCPPEIIHESFDFMRTRLQRLLFASQAATVLRASPSRVKSEGDPNCRERKGARVSRARNRTPVAL
jgi:hypothetical protein